MSGLVTLGAGSARRFRCRRESRAPDDTGRSFRTAVLFLRRVRCRDPRRRRPLADISGEPSARAQSGKFHGACRDRIAAETPPASQCPQTDNMPIAINNIAKIIGPDVSTTVSFQYFPLFFPSSSNSHSRL